MKLARQIPPLLFGERTATTVRSVNVLQDFVANVRGWKGRYDAIGNAGDFVSRTSVMCINGTKLTHVAHTPMHTWVQSDHSSTLFVPIAGPENRSMVNGKELIYSPGETAAFAPEGERLGTGGLRSILMIDIDKQRLRDTVSTMSGKPCAIAGDLNAPITMRLQAGDVRFDQMLRNICGLADQFANSQHMLDRSGLDDVLYRTLAVMSKPETLLETNSKQGIDPRSAFALVRDFITAHLCEPITLTELERISGLSARTLQTLFQRHTGVSPMAWLKRQRLDRARHLLFTDPSIQSITTLALDLGFSSPSRFAADYRRIFGCSPSQDLANL